MRTLDFWYDGQCLSDYNFVVCDFSDSSGISEVSAGSTITFVKVARNSGAKYSLTNTKYSECLSTTFDICKNPDVFLDEDMELTADEFRDDADASRQVLHLLYQNYDLFLLLLTGSYGSSQEHFVDELVAISEQYYRTLSDRQAALCGVAPPDDYTIHWMAHMQIDAFVHLLTHEREEEKALAHLQSILQYMLAGWNGLFH